MQYVTEHTRLHTSCSSVPGVGSRAILAPNGLCLMRSLHTVYTECVVWSPRLCVLSPILPVRFRLNSEMWLTLKPVVRSLQAGFT